MLGSSPNFQMGLRRGTTKAGKEGLGKLVPAVTRESHRATLALGRSLNAQVSQEEETVPPTLY